MSRGVPLASVSWFSSLLRGSNDSFAASCRARGVQLPPQARSMRSYSYRKLLVPQSGLPFEERMINSHDDGSEAHNVQRGKETQSKRKDQFDPDLASSLLRLLPPFRTRHLRMNAKCFPDTGAEPIGLGQHRDERTDLVDSGAAAEILQCFDPWHAGADFGRHRRKFVCDVRM